MFHNYFCSVDFISLRSFRNILTILSSKVPTKKTIVSKASRNSMISVRVSISIKNIL
jgi:hypothetical protein